MYRIISTELAKPQFERVTMFLHVFLCSIFSMQKLEVSFQCHHSRLSLRRTPLGPMLYVHVREVSVLLGVNQKEKRKPETNSRCPL